MNHGILWAGLWFGSQLVIGILAYRQGRSDGEAAVRELWLIKLLNRQKQ